MGLHALLGGPLLLLLASLALGAQVEGTRVPCPDGSGETVVNRLIAQNTIGGWDSDGARYSAGGSFRAWSVSTCPSGLSMLGVDLARGLSPAMRTRIAPVIDEIRAANPTADPTELPAHVRHAHAARIYRALDQPDKEVQLWLSASWLARDRGVGLFKGLDGPVMARRMIEGGLDELDKDLPPDVRKQLTFNLAVVAARAGYPTRRDRFLATMDTLVLTDEERARVQALRDAVQLEATYQDAAIAALTRSLSERRGPSVWTATYQLADLLRRRGRTEQALSAYQVVADQEQAPEALRGLASYFIDELRGGTPWTETRYQRIGAPE